MEKNKASKMYNKRKITAISIMFFVAFFVLIIRVIFLTTAESEHYSKKALEVEERERYIKAARGHIYDRNGKIIATNKMVCTISVIHSQIEDEKQVVNMLSKELDIDKETIEKKVKRVSSREKIKTNVPKETGDRIRKYNLAGVKVDEDYKRYYPYDSLASKVLGFTGADNQGIVGLEAKYDEYLMGIDGKILTMTDAKGVELPNKKENRVESVKGNDLYITIDIDIQKICEKAAKKAMKETKAKRVSIILMNPKNGEIYSMVNLKEYNLNKPFEVGGKNKSFDELNKLWRNESINDTYEPGSTFKIITAASGLEEGVITPDSTFYCPGYKIVDDRRIRCHKVIGHGSMTFTEGTMNSCIPVFIETGLRLGKERFYYYLEKLGIMEKTGIDIAGEAGTIIHKIENVGNVELATMSFGQSFQITPLVLLRAVSAIINGGTLVTPHFAIKAVDEANNKIRNFDFATKDNVIKDSTSETMKMILEKVVSEGTGKNGAIEGYSIGGKTATSEKLPRGNGKYIASYIGFCPAFDPKVIGICIIDEPVGTYYGGTIAAPVIREIYEEALPKLGIKKEVSEG